MVRQIRSKTGQQLESVPFSMRIRKGLHTKYRKLSPKGKDKVKEAVENLLMQILK